MRRYRFDVLEEVITPVEVMAESSQEARELIFLPDDRVTRFEQLRGDLCVLLRSVEDD